MPSGQYELGGMREVFGEPWENFGGRIDSNIFSTTYIFYIKKSRRRTKGSIKITLENGFIKDQKYLPYLPRPVEGIKVGWSNQSD